jgi:hypothetical protein
MQHNKEAILVGLKGTPPPEMGRAKFRGIIVRQRDTHGRAINLSSSTSSSKRYSPDKGTLRFSRSHIPSETEGCLSESNCPPDKLDSTDMTAPWTHMTEQNTSG